MKVVLGTYVAGNSALHRADARSKIVSAMLVAFTLFFIESPLILAIMASMIVAAYLIARIPLKTAVAVMRPIFFIVIFTLAIQSFGSAEGFGFSLEGFYRGLFFTTRILCVMGATALLTLTTSVVDLSDGIASLMKPLSKIKVPVEDIALMMSIGLRFIPTITEELDRIVLTQKMRGAQFDEGSLYRRLKAWVPVFIPLFVGMFRRADELALAMELRGYTGSERTRLNEQTLRSSDIVTMIGVFILCITFIVASNIM